MAFILTVELIFPTCVAFKKECCTTMPGGTQTSAFAPLNTGYFLAFFNDALTKSLNKGCGF